MPASRVEIQLSITSAPCGTFRAQNGEDRWLDRYFKGRQAGFFVEVGAFDGVSLSNTYHFEQIGWTGILIEPDPDNAAQCRAHRPRSRTFECAVVAPEATGEVAFFKVSGGTVYSTTSFTAAHRKRLLAGGYQWREVRVPARTLDSILQEAAAPRLDFVTIDVEGGELQVLRGFDIRRWKPRAVVVESNAKRRDPAVRDYFVRNAYAYHHSIDVNDFYLPAGARWARASDSMRYLGHLFCRRLARLAHLGLRAWNRHVLRNQ